VILFYIIMGSIIGVLALVTWAACTAGAWVDRKAEESRTCACEKKESDGR
jgi:hypothetical protein